MSKLAGKVAIVTGASKGIGAAIARDLAAAGAAVVVNYATSKEGADRVVAAIQAAGGEATAVRADVSTKAEIAALFDAARRAFGRVDVLVNNAGRYEFAPLGQVTEAHFHAQFDLNVLGPILAAQQAAEHFGPEGGSIINISSLVGLSPMANATVYSATKAALDAVTKSLAKELGPRKIRVNAINPGLIETEGVQASGLLGSDFHVQMLARTPLGRGGRPDDIGPIAVFLAADDSRWVTGSTLAAAGGMDSA